MISDCSSDKVRGLFRKDTIENYWDKKCGESKKELGEMSCGTKMGIRGCHITCAFGKAHCGF